MKYFEMIIVSFIIIFTSLFFYQLYCSFKEKVINEKKTRKIIEGINSKNKTIVENKPKKIKKYKRKFFLKKMYKEYIFFDGKAKTFFIILLLGYLILFATLFCISQSISVSLILAVSWVNLFYIYIDKKNEKKRKNYIKGFAVTLRTITASVEAGNTFPEAISSITKKNTINTKIQFEFAKLSNNLKSNKSLDEALELFWKRNSMFTEFSMFVIVMQFYSQKGGEGLGKILVELEKTLNEKIENYSEIDTELGVHKTLMNGIIVFYFIVILCAKLFIPEFFCQLEDNSLGLVKCFLSVILLSFSTYFYKNMIRSSAEG